MQTLQQRFIATGGRASGFDYLRLSLATLVVLLHTVSISYGRMADAVFWYTPLRPLYAITMPMFFALSGFLISGSLERSRTIGMFLGLRALRIYPALVVEVLLSAFILGPLLTNVSLHNYFSNAKFWLYTLNVTGHIHYMLPGLFEKNPLPDTVNGQLWTIPFELLCYISITFLASIGIVKNRKIGPAVLLAFSLLLVVARLIKYHGHFPEILGSFPGSLLVISFLSGVTFYLYRNVIAWSASLCVAAAIFSWLVLQFVPGGDFIVPVPIAYVTVYLGLTNFPRVGFLKHADLSYGVYLYGFVVQQAVVAIFPWSRQWVVNFLISMPFAIAMAALSWHFIEKPALNLRSYLRKIEDHYLLRRERQSVMASGKVR